MADVKRLDRQGQHYFQVVEANWAQTNSGADQLYIRAVAHFWLNPETNQWDDCVGGAVTSIYLYPNKQDGTPNKGFDEQMKAAFGFDVDHPDALSPEKLKGQYFQAAVKPHRKYAGSFECGWISHMDDQGKEKKPVQAVAMDDVAARMRAARQVPPTRTAAGVVGAGAVPVPPVRK